jgi:hypothetical protein
VRERHWALLALLAEHAVLDTGQVVELMFGSRPAAARHLGVLVRAGLVWRLVNERDPSHRAHYEVSPVGLRMLAERLHRAGQAGPVSLAATHRDQYLINDVHVGLVRAARASQGRAWLYGWRRGADVAVWLYGRGVSSVQPAAAGVWLQNGRAVRFLLHADDDAASPLSRTPAPPAARALDGYRHSRAGVPATVVLVVTATNEREQQLHRDLAAAPLPVPVASTTLERLSTAPDPSAAIWTATSTEPGQLVRLIDLTP